MFTPPTLAVALLMMITSAICWGSWANTYKGVKNYRFELFYWDYAVGIFLISLIFAFTMGSTGNDSSSFLNNVRSADNSNIVWTMIGGAIFNLANLLLVAAIDMAGLSVALPVSIGIALVVGVVLKLHPSTKGKRVVPGSGCGVRIDRCRARRKSLWQLGFWQVGLTQEHHHLHRFWSVDGPVGPLRDALDDAGKYAWALQRGRVPHSWRATFVLDLEYLFHEEAVGR